MSSGPAAEEIFDIVNEKDEVIGRLPRSQVHREGHRHRATHVLVFNRRGDIFLQKRSQHKDKYPGRWDSSAAGHLDSGEDYDSCAIRETREELGVTLPQAPQRLFYIAACEDTGQEFVWVYHAEYDGPFILCPKEIESGDWFAPAKVDEWVATRPDDFAPGFSKIWKQYRAEKGAS